VADSGIGISSEQQVKLFSMFGQAESGTSRKFGGTGLGLAISKRIIELMKGKIWIESDLGKGARFIFTVKMQKHIDSVLPDKDIQSEEHIEKFTGKKLLLVEDIEINREILLTLLEDSGLIIDTAENGKDALDMITASGDKYDIVFMDLQMPLMDGYEAARQIRLLESKANPPKKIPIIAMTANVFKEDIDACLAAGMDDHLGKPLDVNDVFSKLHKYLA
jgi:CheY-like chemotaxis protein